MGAYFLRMISYDQARGRTYETGRYCLQVLAEASGSGSKLFYPGAALIRYSVFVDHEIPLTS